jgi:site-specific recombinase XerD
MGVEKQSDGQWKADVRPTGANGKRYRRVFKTKGEALRWSAWVISKKQVDHSWNPKRKDQRRLSELIDLWFRLHGSQLKDGKGRKRLLHYFAEKVGDPFAADFTQANFTGYRETRLEQGIAPNTINHEHAYLRAMFNELERLGEWKGNPLGKIRQLKIDERELSFLNAEQIETLLEVLNTPRRMNAYKFACTSMATGGRYSEILSLYGDNVQPRSITLIGTKNGKTRTVPISQTIYELIMTEPGRLVFQDCKSTIRRAFGKANIQLPDGQLIHVFRHTFASHFMMNGGNILVLQKLLGHASLAMTVKYAHLSPDHLREAVEFNPMANYFKEKIEK